MTQTTTVTDYIEQIKDTWNTNDPKLLVFHQAEYEPAIAHIDGELWGLSSSLVYPREIDKEYLQWFIEEHGEPEVRSFSATDLQRRFTREQFEDRPGGDSE